LLETRFDVRCSCGASLTACNTGMPEDTQRSLVRLWSQRHKGPGHVIVWKEAEGEKALGHRAVQVECVVYDDGGVRARQP
jgi:hypothetical protein